MEYENKRVEHTMSLMPEMGVCLGVRICKQLVAIINSCVREG